MKDQGIAFVLVLALLAVFAESATIPGLIRLPLQRASSNSNDTRLNNLSKDVVTTNSGAIVAGLDNRQDLGYYVDFFLGTPGQPNRLVVDTGSNQLWVGSKTCNQMLKCNDNVAFSSSASSTFMDVSDASVSNITYGKGSVSGYRSTDVFRIGSIKLPDQPFLLVEKEDAVLWRQVNKGFSGILGLAFVGGMGPLPPALAGRADMQGRTVMHRLIEQQLITRPVFSLALASVGGSKIVKERGGELVIGGIDPNQHSGTLTWYSVADVASKYYWSIALTEAQMAPSGVSILPPGAAAEGKLFAVMDSGSSFMNVDAATFRNLFTQLSAAVPVFMEKTTQLITFKSCADVGRAPALELQFGGGEKPGEGKRFFQISADDYVIQSEGVCIVGIVPSATMLKDGSILWIVGDTFLRRVFSAYDFSDDGRVGLAYAVNMEFSGSKSTGQQRQSQEVTSSGESSATKQTTKFKAGSSPSSGSLNSTSKGSGSNVVAGPTAKFSAAGQLSSGVDRKVKSEIRMDDTARLFIGFGTANVDAEAVRGLLAPLSQVKDVHLSTAKGCAHVTLNKDSLAKCIKTLNGTKWKGSTLKVEPAAPHYLDRLAKERESTKISSESALLLSNEAKSAKRRLKRLVRSLPVITDPNIDTPVTDKNWDTRKEKGWKLVKSARRAVLVVKLKPHRDAKKIIKIDPSKYANKIVKLFPRANIADASVTELEWPGIEWRPPARKPAPPTVVQSKSDLPQDSKKPLISSLAKKSISLEVNEIMPPRSTKKWMPSFLDSDDEDEDSSSDTEKAEADKTDDTPIIVPEDLTEERENSMSILRGLLGMTEPTEESRAAHAPVMWRETVRFDPFAEGADELLRNDDDMDADFQPGPDAVVDEDTGIDEKDVEEEHQPMDVSESAEPVAAEASSSSYVVNTNLRSLVFGEDDSSTSNSGGLFSWLGNTPKDEEPSGPGLQGDAIREKVGGVIKSAEKFSLLGALGLDSNDIETEQIEDGVTVKSASTSAKAEGAPINFGTTALFFFHFNKHELKTRTLYENENIFRRTNTM
ncbi:hypothetical protein HDU80_009778 [Chytriomyces hyalinus]|nr:hypothetical protein HDU80_009778 [Chytriomyces hyalinus]